MIVRSLLVMYLSTRTLYDMSFFFMVDPLLIRVDSTSTMVVEQEVHGVTASPTLPLSYHYNQWKMLKPLPSKAYRAIPLCHIEELSYFLTRCDGNGM